jgi:hypothetical protein
MYIVISSQDVQLKVRMLATENNTEENPEEPVVLQNRKGEHPPKRIPGKNWL